MGLGVRLNLVCIGIALMGIDGYHFLVASLILGVGWNFLFTSATSLALTAYRPEETDKAQGAIIDVKIFLGHPHFYCGVR